jgi:hypothetical protein
VIDRDDADAYRAEYERLRAAGEHVARAVAEVIRAREQVGDHASAVGLSESSEGLQLIQAQIAAAAERAYSMGQMAARRAQNEARQRQINDAANHLNMSDDR